MYYFFLSLATDAHRMIFRFKCPYPLEQSTFYSINEPKVVFDYLLFLIWILWMPTLNFIHHFLVMFLIFPALGWCDRNSVEYPASSHSRISWFHWTCRLPSRVSSTDVHLGIMGSTLCSNTEILYRTDCFCCYQIKELVEIWIILVD